MTRRPHPDVLAVAALVALWLLFFWRLFTPIAADQASLTHGDFSGQFVAFAGYQYARFATGEIPLWNPYNNGGLPFIADTQAAVFYPPRLATIFLSKLAGGWSYHALELEMTAHVLAYTLMMYALVHRMTQGKKGSVFGAFVAALVAGYNGFTSGYPPLQLALLEAAVWLPLGVLGVQEATRTESVRWRWLVVVGFALGMSWMAGHPQTSYFLTVLMVAFCAYRIVALRLPVSRFAGEVGVFGLIAFGMAAVQLLPGVEYLAHTARAGFEYDAKGNGFPIQDVLQFFFPGVVSLYSPLFVGVVGLVLALIAAWRRLPQTRFWITIALVALVWSFGANAALYPLLYNVLPGLRFFRGQERAAFLVVNSLAILAGLGAAHLLSWDALREYGALLRLRVYLNRLFVTVLIFGALAVVSWVGNPTAYGALVTSIALTTLVIGALLVLLPAIILQRERPVLPLLMAALLIIELFTVTMDADAVYDPVPPAEQLSMQPPTLFAPALADDRVFRVDGFRGLTDNYGSLYGIMDMRGISPLFLSGPFALIEPDKINPLAWELFAVCYVATDWQELPVPSEIVTMGDDRFGAVNLHRLENPRLFAHLVYAVNIADSDASAHALLRDSAFNPRETVILSGNPGIALPDQAPDDGLATIAEFAPESFTVEVSTEANAILTLAHPYYPGWRATLDGEPVDILRAYGALSAVPVPAGEHVVQLVYDPLTYRIGAIISLVTWAGLSILLVAIILRGVRQKALAS